MAKDSEVNREAALGFRDELRNARFKVQRDGEAFEEIVFVIEKLGYYLRKKEGDLGKYRSCIDELARQSPLFDAIPDHFRGLHTPFPILYDLVRRGRNDRMHMGLCARHSARHAVQLALVLENALMNTLTNSNDKVADFMVENPICAAPWQPLRFIRQTMLVNSFSWLPVNTGTATEPKWQLVSDKAVTQYLRSNRVPLKKLLAQPLKKAITDDGFKLVLEEAQTCLETAPVQHVLEDWNGQPRLVMHGETGELLGILTTHDLL